MPFPYKPYEYQSKAIKDLSRALSQRKSTILFESPTGTGKTQVVLSALLHHLSSVASSNRIFYFTRTVSQMSHVVNEAKKSGFRLRACVLSSRKHLCVNSKVSALGSLGKINKKCISLLKNSGCSYNSSFSKGDLLRIPKLMDLEDMRGFGQKHYKCPFFMSRKSIKTANLIVLSYNYMTNPIYRELFSKHFRNSLILIDEAHNMESVFEESASIDWNMFIFKLIKKQIKIAQDSPEIALKESGSCFRNRF